MKISDFCAKNVCKFGARELTCSYLALGDGFECLKGTGFENLIKQRRAAKNMGAMGDNCSGPPDFVVTQETVN